VSPGRGDYPRAPGPGSDDGPTVPDRSQPGERLDESSQPPWPERPPKRQRRDRDPKSYLRYGLAILGLVFITILGFVIHDATHTSSSHVTQLPQQGGGSDGGSQPQAPPILDYHAHVVSTSSTTVNLTNPSVGMPDQTFRYTQAMELTNRNPSYVPAVLRIQLVRDGQPIPIQSPIVNGQASHGGTQLLIPGAQQVFLTVSYLRGPDIGDHVELQISSNTGLSNKESPAVWFDEETGTGYDFGQAHR
jgi:hypothetical protein